MNSERLRIFIAEDEAIIRTGFRLSLQSMGHEIVGEASNGDQAVEDILRIQPELALMDINMPGMNGILAMKACRKVLDIPFIVISGHFTDALLDEAGKAGAFAYLIKPIDENQMKAALNLAVSKYNEIAGLKDDKCKLQAALEERKLVERAKGIYMRLYHIPEEEAMKRLQQNSRNQNKKIAILSQEIIEASKLLDL